jgi:glutamine synthetase
MGYQPMAGSELEYYIFNNSYRQAAAAGYNGLEAAGWYLEDYHVLQGTREEKLNGAVRRHLAQSGIPVECSKGEWGKGQHELNVRYTDILTMADRTPSSNSASKKSPTVGHERHVHGEADAARPDPAVTCT